jgi:hypothetical protein
VFSVSREVSPSAEFPLDSCRSRAIRNLRAENPDFGSGPARLPGEQKTGRMEKIENRE